MEEVLIQILLMVAAVFFPDPRAAKDSMFKPVGLEETGTAKLERKTAGYRTRTTP